MTPERWKRIEELFHAASALPPDAHRAFLAAACPDDERLQARRRGALERVGVRGRLPGPTRSRHRLAVRRRRGAGRDDGAIARRLSPAGAARRGRHGRGVPFARREARPRCRDQDPAARVHERPGSARPLRARSADARGAESSRHLRDLRLRGSGRRSLPGARARRGRDARGQDRVGTDAFGRGRPVHSPRRWPSRARSPRHSRSRTTKGSSTAT